MADLTVCSANIHNARAAVDWLAARSRKDAPEHFDIGCVYEAHTRRRQLRRLPGHDYYTGDERGMSQSTGILLDRRLPLDGRSFQRVTDELPAFPSVGKERHGHDLLTEVIGVPLAAIALHPPAGPAVLSGHDPAHPIVREYAAAIRWLEATIKRHEAARREYVVCMDAQMFAGWERPWSVHAVFAEHGVKTVWDRIDLVGYSPGLALVGAPAKRVRQINGQDHPFLWVELDINRTKRRKKP